MTQIIDILITSFNSLIKYDFKKLNILDPLPLSLIGLACTYLYSLKRTRKNFVVYNTSLFIGMFVIFLSTISTSEIIDLLKIEEGENIFKKKLKKFIKTHFTGFNNYLIYNNSSQNFVLHYLLQIETPLFLEHYISSKYISAEFVEIFVTFPFLSTTLYGLVYEFLHLLYSEDPLYEKNPFHKGKKYWFSYENWFDEEIFEKDSIFNQQGSLLTNEHFLEEEKVILENREEEEENDNDRKKPEIKKSEKKDLTDEVISLAKNKRILQYDIKQTMKTNLN